MTPTALLHAAERMATHASPATEGLWARSAAILGRQALEGQLHHELGRLAPGARATDFTCKLLCLLRLSPNPALANRVSYAWAALSAATHHHAYELPPTADELRDWLAIVREFVVS